MHEGAKREKAVDCILVQSGFKPSLKKDIGQRPQFATVAVADAAPEAEPLMSHFSYREGMEPGGTPDPETSPWHPRHDAAEDMTSLPPCPEGRARGRCVRKKRDYGFLRPRGAPVLPGVLALRLGNALQDPDWLLHTPGLLLLALPSPLAAPLARRPGGGTTKVAARSKRSASSAS